MTKPPESAEPEARVTRETAAARLRKDRGQPGDGDRDSSGTGDRRWKSGTPAPDSSRVAHRTPPVNGSAEPPHSEEVETSPEEGFPHIHSSYYCY